VRIELAQRTHLTQIPAIELAAASMFSELDLPQNVRYRVTDTETLRDAWDDSRIWVALNYADKAVGFAMADIVDGQAHLDEMNVLPDYGRRGIGTQLVQTVKEWARRKGFHGLTLITFGHLPWNAPFYERLGFVRLKQAEQGDGLTDLIDDEAEFGVDISKRVCMKLQLEQQVWNPASTA
jgi:GNAT superfamily N-acetyltransferase